VLSRLSYDDPGTDDDEVLELSVLGTFASYAHFSDCGLARLELTSAAPLCSVYRTLELGELAIPPNGHLVVCVAGGPLDTDLGCDLTSSSVGALQPGWMQNAVGSGVRGVDSWGGAVFDYTYGPGDCGDADRGAEILPLDLEFSDSEDHVIARCEHGYQYLPLSAAPLRGGSCAADGGTGQTVEAEPEQSAGSLFDASVISFTRPSAGLLEAGPMGPPSDSRKEPPELGCGVAPPHQSASGFAVSPSASALALTLGLGLTRRRQRCRP
jgi:hypothetical protein